MKCLSSGSKHAESEFIANINIEGTTTTKNCYKTASVQFQKQQQLHRHPSLVEPISKSNVTKVPNSKLLGPLCQEKSQVQASKDIYKAAGVCSRSKKVKQQSQSRQQIEQQQNLVGVVSKQQQQQTSLSIDARTAFK